MKILRIYNRFYKEIFYRNKETILEKENKIRNYLKNFNKIIKEKNVVKNKKTN